MPDQLEVEQKFRVDSFELVRAGLAGFHSEGTCEEHDTYLAHPVRNFGETDEAFRVRTRERDDEPVTHVLTYKGPKQGGSVKTRVESEIPAGVPGSDRSTVLTFFARLGFAPVADVRKRRETYAGTVDGRTVHVTLDDVAGAGRFVEIETIVSKAEEGQPVVRSVAGRLGLSEETLESRSYLALVLGGQAVPANRDGAGESR